MKSLCYTLSTGVQRKNKKTKRIENRKKLEKKILTKIKNKEIE